MAVEVWLALGEATLEVLMAATTAELVVAIVALDELWEDDGAMVVVFLAADELELLTESLLELDGS